MARKIIIQERVNEPSDFSFRYVFWLDVPANRQSFYADALKKSVVKDATVAELTAIQSGAIIEVTDTAEYPAGTPLATVQSKLVTKYNALQTETNNRNPWKYFGSFWNGTSWVINTVS